MFQKFLISLSVRPGSLAAIRAHLLPNWACNSTMILSSSAEKFPFLRLGLRWLVHRSRQLLPHRASTERFCRAFQFPSPCLFTYSISMASSAAVHGPFFSSPPPPSSSLDAEIWASNSSMILSSSAEKAPSLALGLRCVVHRTRQLLPHRGSPESLCTAFQFLSPYLFTCSISMASSSADHGPFFSWDSPPSSPPLDIEDDPPSLLAPTPSMFPTGSII